MHPLAKKTATLLQQQKLVTPGSTVVIGVSGGPDSMALLHVLAALTPVIDCSLVAVYVDHGLRAGETEAEASLVRDQANRLGVQVFVETVQVRNTARQEGGSLEQAARQLRYGVLETIARQQKAAAIAVGHTADDQAEEVLLRLIRGTGRKGLAGMALIRDGQVIRPFLPVTKKEILRYLQDRDIPFLEDSSNQDRSFLRNRVRLDLLPYLRDHFHAGVDTILRQTATILADEEHLLAGITEKAYRQCLDPENTQLEAARNDAAPLGLIRAELSQVPRAIQRRILEKACWAMGQRPGFRQIEQLLTLLATADGSRQLHLAGGLRVSQDARALRFSYPKGRRPLRGSLLPAQASKLTFTINAPGSYPLPELRQTIHLAEVAALPADLDPAKTGNALYFDLEKMPFPLTLRSPRAGDAFFPLNGPGRKKISDYLIDAKVERHRRWQTPVLVTGKQIAALINHRIDHGFRVTDKTGTVLKVWMTPL